MSTEKKAEQNKLSVATIKFVREAGVISLYIKTDPALESFFETETKTPSKNYLDADGNPLQFYAFKPAFDNFVKNYTGEFRESVRSLDNYGNKLYRGGELNFSIIRTVGITQGITLKIQEPILDEEIQTWLRSFAQFAKFVYHSFVLRREITAEVIISI